MNEPSYATGDMIAALATPWGKSALAVIRTSGGGAVEAVAGLFSRGKELLSATGGTMILGTLKDRETGLSIDQVLLGVFRAPASYTGEDSVELYCHGNPHGIERILKTLGKEGFRNAGPGEFTLRAFINGKLDLTRAEAVHEVVTAHTETAHSLALNRLAGAVERLIGGVREELLALASSVELELDYPEEELPADRGRLLETVTRSREALSGLADTYRVGKIYREGIRVAIAGRTNAGKSSLFNLLLREERSIVSELHGTTRDYIESWVSLQGIPFLFYDTAGLRDSVDFLESEGIRRSERVIAGADIVLYVVDSLAGISVEDERRISSCAVSRPCIVVMNKSDLLPPDSDSRKNAAGQSAGSAPNSPAPDPDQAPIPFSAMTGQGLGELQRRLVLAAAGGEPQRGTEIVIDSQRQKELIDRALSALGLLEEGLRNGAPLDAAALDLHEALQALGEITGEVTTDDILTAMFGRFCVGK